MVCFSMSIVPLTNSAVNKEEEVTLPLCPPNSLSCIDLVSLGTTGVSEKVNLG